MSMRKMSLVFVYSYDMSKRVSGSGGITMDCLGEYLRAYNVYQNIPEKFYHPVIRVFGTLYDYNKSGIHKRCNIEEGYDEEASDVYKTMKTNHTEFEEWIESQHKVYSAENYHMVYNNCIKFVEAACSYLEIPMPVVLQRIQNWLYDNRDATMMKVVGILSGYSDDLSNAITRNM